VKGLSHGRFFQASLDNLYRSICEAGGDQGRDFPVGRLLETVAKGERIVGQMLL